LSSSHYAEARPPPHRYVDFHGAAAEASSDASSSLHLSFVEILNSLKRILLVSLEGHFRGFLKRPSEYFLQIISAFIALF
jgi:hypothetical protein